MKVAIVTNAPSPYRVHFYNNLEAELRTRNGGLAVIYSTDREPDRHWEIDQSLIAYETRYLRPATLPGSKGKLHINLDVLTALQRLEPDVVVNGNYIRPTSRLAGWWCAAKGRPCVWWNESHLQSARFSSKPAQLLRRMLMRRIRYVAVPGERALEFLRFHGWTGRHVFVPNLVDERVYVSEVDRRRGRTPANESYRQWLMVCRLEEEKGVEEFLRNITPEDPVRLAIAGSGSRQRAIEELIESRELYNVDLLGFCGQEEIVKLLASHSTFVLPSFRDPSPLSLVEASAAGLALLVSSRVGNSRELCKEGESGTLFEPGDSKSTREAIERAISWTPTDLAECGERSRAIYEEGFSTRVVVNRFVDFLEGVQRQPSAKPR